MSAALQAVLALIQQVLPLLGQSTGLAGIIIQALVKWMPFIVMEVEAVRDPVKQIIEVLTGSGEVTQAQIIKLKELDAKLDAAFDAAIEGLDPDAGDQ